MYFPVRADEPLERAREPRARNPRSPWMTSSATGHEIAAADPECGQVLREGIVVVLSRDAEGQFRADLLLDLEFAAVAAGMAEIVDEIESRRSSAVHPAESCPIRCRTARR